MQIACLHDRDQIAAFLRRHSAQRAYELGDLDDFFWPATTWYALAQGAEIAEIALIYNSGDLPVLLVTGAASPGAARELLRRIRHLLPRRIYAHLGPGMAEELAGDYGATPADPHHKMALSDRAALMRVDVSETIQLLPHDLAEVAAFYQAAYPENWFDPRMLETGHYYGVRADGALQCVAGVHVYSPSQRVAALGNITTHPAARGRGLATRVTARLCRELLQSVAEIGLNVRASNAAAIACYRRLGFTHAGDYDELTLTARVATT